jgi:hypothetical protein
MSMYQKAWLFLAWTLLVFFTIPFWLGELQQVFGAASYPIAGVFWLSHGVVALLVFRCPDCGRSLFTRGMWSVPWPAKTCSKCGRDTSAA